MSDAPRKRGRPRKHPLPAVVESAPALDEREIPAAEWHAAVVAGARALAEHVPEPQPTGRVRWKGSSGAHPRTALQVAWQCAGGIEWRHIEVVGPDAPDTEDAP